MESAIYEGRLRHRRFSPTENEFSYSVFMAYLDLAELDRVFEGRWLWSTKRRALAEFRRADHLGDPSVPLDEAVRDLVLERTGRRPSGPIRLLTNLRYFGYVMNPVSFYFCIGERGVETIVAEVHNTPWGERHLYVLDEGMNLGSPERQRYRLAKEFHVSPFMDMDQTYDWRLSRPGGMFSAHMKNLEDGRTCLDATLTLRRREITGARLARTLLQHPFMTGKVVAGIYWQALRLKLKRTPFFTHPKKRAESPAGVL